MRVFLDTNVVYPSILRAILLGFAKADFFDPLWSDRVIEEWHRAAIRNGSEAEAKIEIALFKTAWSGGYVPNVKPIDDLLLPDLGDHHIVEAAIAGSADAILTANNADFPTKTLGRYGLLRYHPDMFLRDAFHHNSSTGSEILEHARQEAETRSGKPIELPALLKRLRLNQLRKVVLSAG